VTHRYRHDFSFLNSNFAQCVAGFFDQRIEDTWCELEVFENLAQLVEFFQRDFVLAPFLGQDFFGFNPLLAELFEAFFGFPLDLDPTQILHRLHQLPRWLQQLPLQLVRCRRDPSNPP
jgi:hypothetical protein